MCSRTENGTEPSKTTNMFQDCAGILQFVQWLRWKIHGKDRIVVVVDTGQVDGDRNIQFVKLLRWKVHCEDRILMVVVHTWMMGIETYTCSCNR